MEIMEPDKHRSEPEAYSSLDGLSLWVSALSEDADADEVGILEERARTRR
jgi:hypothetical protein